MYQRNPALYEGSFSKIESTNDDKIYAFLRQKKENSVLVILNLSDQAQSLALKSQEITGEYVELFTEEAKSLSGMDDLNLAPWEYRVYTSGTPGSN